MFLNIIGESPRMINLNCVGYIECESVTEGGVEHRLLFKDINDKVVLCFSGYTTAADCYKAYCGIVQAIRENKSVIDLQITK